MAWINEYDSEVQKFHPVCKTALEEALCNLGLSQTYEVEHHRHVGKLEMDLVVSNKSSKKVLCVIEVKRTIPAVYSTRYQFQAMSYVQSLNTNEKESNFYILTNLECSCLFKYSNKRPKVFQQMIEPGMSMNHRFDEVPETTFRQDLAKQYTTMLKEVLNNSSKYVMSFDNFAGIIQGIKSITEWNSTLCVLLFEYIRGSMNSINRNSLHDINILQTLSNIRAEGSSINFHGIFGLDSNKYSQIPTISQNILNECYKLGETYGDGDALCNIMHGILSEGHEHEGEVPTDQELALILMGLTRLFHPKLSENDIIIDPAAGSGTLLSSANEVFPSISPKQFYANDIKENLLQVLSLRLGLKYSNTVCPTNSPRVTAKNICALTPNDFNSGKIIVLNPPFLSSTAKGCVARKKEINNRIKQITGHDASTNIGQASLECLFIELVTYLAQENSVIACIVPNTHLTRAGEAEVAFRKFLLNEFGLKMIFSYPHSDLFDTVTQATSVLIGIKGVKTEKIIDIESHKLISDIDLSELNSIDIAQMVNTTIEITPSVTRHDFLPSDLSSINTMGWNILDSIIRENIIFLDKILSTKQFCHLYDTHRQGIKRGTLGNTGGTTLLYITKNRDFYDEVRNVVTPYLCAGINNSKYPKYIVGNGDYQFLNTTNMSESDIDQVIDVYINKYQPTESKQNRNLKTHDQLKQILKNFQDKATPKSTILIPRGTRRYGNVYLTDRKTYVSSNFFPLPMGSTKESVIIGSWMNTIFYQIELEDNGINEKGMRKLEEINVLNTRIPKVSELSKENINDILNTPILDFLDLRDPQIRRVDEVWAKILTGKDKNKELLEEAKLKLSIIARHREN